MTWSERSLASVTERVEKREPSTLDRSTFRYVDIGSIDSGRHAIVGAQSLRTDAAPGRARQVLRTGDTVFSTVRPYLEKIALVGEHFDGEIASTGFCVLRPGPLLDPKYLFYFATSRRLLDQVLPLQRGVSYPAVLDKDVLGAAIPAPDLDEQRRIVDILDDHLSRLDAADAALTKASSRSIALHRTQRRAALGSRNARTVGELATVGTGSTPSRSRPDFFGGSIPWLTSADLNAGIVESASQHVTEAGAASARLKLWPAGTVLLALYGEGRTRGTSAELRFPASINQACAAIVPRERDEWSAPWIRLALEDQYESMRRRSSGGVQPNLNLAIVRSIAIPWASASERAARLTAFEETRVIVERTRHELQAVRFRSASLRRSLLQAAFAGRLTGSTSDLDHVEEFQQIDDPGDCE